MLQKIRKMIPGFENSSLVMNTGEPRFTCNAYTWGLDFHVMNSWGVVTPL
jgi:hypothetical protein